MNNLNNIMPARLVPKTDERFTQQRYYENCFKYTSVVLFQIVITWGHLAHLTELCFSPDMNRALPQARTPRWLRPCSFLELPIGGLFFVTGLDLMAVVNH